MDADDVTQEVLIRIWKHMGKFNLLAAKTWIMKTTHNLCIDYLRKRNAMIMKEVDLNDESGEMMIESNVEISPIIKTHYSMMTIRIKNAVKKLPENLRSVFVLYEIQGLKYSEISKALEMPINSVKVYLMRARIKLQEELKNLEIYEAN
jgi:RNA polymerase sigma-70 factor (ECF subfamily)